MEVLETLFNVATVEIIFVIVVFKLILNNYEPPIQQSIQAFICVCIGVILAMIIETSVHSFMIGVISSGLGFYGGTYINEIRCIKDNMADDKDNDNK